MYLLFYDLSNQLNYAIIISKILDDFTTMSTIPTKLTTKTFFTYYIYQINDSNSSISKLDRCNRLVVRIAQVISAILTIGLLPLASYYIWGRHKVVVISLTPPAPSPLITPAPDQATTTLPVPNPPATPVSGLPLAAVAPERVALVERRRAYFEDLAMPSPLIPKTDEVVDVKFLQMLLNDFVGGDTGSDPDRGVDFIKGYLSRYLALFPADIHAAAIARDLSNYVYRPDEKVPLDDVVSTLLGRLEESGYVAMAGGYTDMSAGHALFYEFILETDRKVTFKFTNSGDGVCFHPKFRSTGSGINFYRTLSLSGATIEDLQKSTFLKLLISFKRKRPPIRKLDGTLNALRPQISSAITLYKVLLYNWPVTCDLKSENPGRAQRSGSCSLQGLMKWIKGQCERNHHPWMTLWIKLSAFSDYLENSDAHSSQFINDALRKMSTHIDKMDKASPIPPQLFEAWKEIYTRAKLATLTAHTVSSAARSASALSSIPYGLGLNVYEVVVLKEIKPLPQTSLKTGYDYFHRFPGEAPSLTELPTLSKQKIATPYSEMAYRLNFLRLLPDCNSTNLVEPDHFTELGDLIELFFYTEEAFPEFHIPDSHFVDLFNGWMTLYLKARSEGSISKAVFLEWLEGANLLLTTYSTEYIFDSREAVARWKKIKAVVSREHASLLAELGESYKPPPNYWSVYHRRFNSNFEWLPFGQKFTEYAPGKVSAPPVEKLEDLPAMAKFQRELMLQAASLPKPTCEDSEINEEKDNTPEELFIIRAHHIEARYKEGEWSRCWFLDTPLKREIAKCIDAFGCNLPVIPHYDPLKRGMAVLFSVADRFLNKTTSSSFNNRSEKRSLVVYYPEISKIEDRHEVHHPCINIVGFFGTSRLLKGRALAEYCIPKSGTMLAPLRDLNDRVMTVYLEERRHFPSMTLLEEKELMIFALKEDLTTLPEVLSLFKTCLNKISLPFYQGVLEYLLFSEKRMGVTLSFFKSGDLVIPLLFQFIEKGYDELLKRSPATQSGAAALFHIHLRLFQIAVQNKQGDIDGLIRVWERLIEAGRINPILGNALGKGVLAALSSLEFIALDLEKHPKILELLVTTVLQSAIPGDFPRRPYSILSLEYGFQVFKSMLRRSAKPFEILERAASQIFGEEEAKDCKWELEKDKLTLKTISINLSDQTIDGGDDFSMRLIPRDLLSESFEELFGERNFLSHFRMEGATKIYAFNFRGNPYELRDKSIYKKFNGIFYKKSCFQGLPSDHYFRKMHIFWKFDSQIIIEDETTGKPVAIGSKSEIHRIDDQNNLTSDILALFHYSEFSFLHSVFKRVTSRGSVLIWTNPVTNQITRIDLPNLKLHFFVETEPEERIISQDFPGFYVAPHQHVTFLNNFCGALILENSKGQKKVIVPTDPFYPPQKYQPYSERDLFLNLSNLKTEYLTFDLSSPTTYPEFSPKPSNQTKIIWLISLYLHTHEYKRALDLLTESTLSTKSSFSKLAKTILENSVSTTKNDIHPHAIAIRVRLYLLLGDAFKKDNQYNIEYDLCLYENTLHSMGLFALSTADLLTLRATVKPNLATPFPSDLGADCSYDTHVIPDEIRKEIFKAFQSGEPIPMLSLSAPGEDFILNFLTFHQIIASGNFEEIRKLKPLLYLTYNDTNPLIKTLSRVLIKSLVDTGSTIPFEEIVQLFSGEENHLSQKFSSYLKDFAPNLSTSDWLSPISKMYHPPTHYTCQGEKTAITPRDYFLIDSFRPLFPITLSFTSTPIDFGALEQGLTSFVPVSFDEDRRAIDALSSFAKERPSLSRIRIGAEKLLSDLDASPTTKEVVTGEIASTLERYATEIAKRETLLSAMESSILKEANHLHEDRRLHLEFGRDLRSPFDIETLLIALGRGDLSIIQNCNPSLTEGEISEIMQRVFTYAHLKGDVQQLKRAHESLQKGAYDDYLSHARAKRCYAPSEYPKLLVFEALSNVLLREEQKLALVALTETTSWTLFEARTGFGKSKVLLPLWLLLTANESLAIFIAPQTIFDSQEGYLQSLLKKGYRFFGERIEFSRSSPSTELDIREIEGKLRRAEVNRRPVFMSDQTAHNLFVLKAKELATSATTDNGAAIGAFISLKQYVKEKKAFIDEPHKVLDDASEFNYSIGMPVTATSERILLEMQIYKELVSCTHDHYHLEFWGEKDLPPLTDKIYRTDILPMLLDRLIQTGALTANSVDIAYLLGAMDLESQERYEGELATKGDENSLLIRILHDQLHHFLPQTIQKNSNEHYGVVDVESTRIAIPLEDARNPKEGNEFVSLDQMLNFTLQANLKIPFSFSFIESYLQMLEAEATEEADKNAIALNKTNAYRQFCLITRTMTPPAPNFVSPKPHDIERIHTHINSNLEAKLQLIRLEILPQVRHFHEKVSSTPHLLMNCFGQVVGASGTLSMEHFPHQFEVIGDEKAVAKTLATLLKRNDPVSEIDSLDHLHEIYPDASVIIEVGAALRHYPSLEAIAYDLLAMYPKFGGVATFDQLGNPIVLKQGSKQFIAEDFAGVPREALFWIYGQKDITGRDEKLPKEAEAIVFVNQHTTLTQLVQGVGRMRGIHTGQIAKIAIDKQSSARIKDSLGLPQIMELSLIHLIQYFSEKEDLSRGLANFRSLPLQLNALVEDFFWKGALNAPLLKRPLEITRALHAARSYFSESTKDDPLLRQSLTLELVDKEVALKQIKSDFDRKIKEIKTLRAWTLSSIDETAMETARSHIETKMRYPEKVPLHHAASGTQSTEVTSDQSVTHQVSVLADTAATTQVETETETDTMSLQLAWANTLKGKSPVPHLAEIEPIPIEEIFSHPRLIKFLPLIHRAPLHLSLNSIVTFSGDSKSAPGFVNGYMKPLNYIARLEDGRFVLIDTDEANTLLKARSAPLLWLIDGGPLLQAEGTVIPMELYFCEVLAKLLNGDLNFNRQQEQIYTVCFVQTNKPLLDGFIHEVLKPLHPLLKI